MAVAAGGRVVRAPEPVHGRLSTLLHNGHELFAGCPSGPHSGFDVVRWARLEGLLRVGARAVHGWCMDGSWLVQGPCTEGFLEYEHLTVTVTVTWFRPKP